MNVNYAHPFIESFGSVMANFGFSDVHAGTLLEKPNQIVDSGLIVVLGIVGDIKGNVAYIFKPHVVKGLASAMMGMQVDEIDDMSKSAISELCNMLTANAATVFSSGGTNVNISTPTMLDGENISIKMASGTILCVEMQADSVSVEINLSFEN